MRETSPQQYQLKPTLSFSRKAGCYSYEGSAALSNAERGFPAGSPRALPSLHAFCNAELQIPFMQGCWTWWPHRADSQSNRLDSTATLFHSLTPSSIPKFIFPAHPSVYLARHQGSWPSTANRSQGAERQEIARGSPVLAHAVLQHAALPYHKRPISPGFKSQQRPCMIYRYIAAAVYTLSGKKIQS